jgi:hypothetical protein
MTGMAVEKLSDAQEALDEAKKLLPLFRLKGYGFLILGVHLMQE